MSSLREERQRRFNKLLMEKFNLISEEATESSENQIRDLISQDTVESRKQAASLMRSSSDLIKKFGTSENKKEVGVAAMAYAPDIKSTYEYGGKTKFLTQVATGMGYEHWGDIERRADWERNNGIENVTKAEAYAAGILKQKYGLAPDGGVATDESDLETWLREQFSFPVWQENEETGEMEKHEFLPDTPANLKAWKHLGAKAMSWLPGIPGIGDFSDWAWGQSDDSWGKPGYYDALGEENKARKAAIANHYTLISGQATRILGLPEPEKYGIDPEDVLGYINPYDEEGNYWIADPGMISLGPRGFDYASRQDWEFRKEKLEGVMIDKETDTEKLRKELEIKDEEIIPKIPWYGKAMPAEYMASVKDFSSKTKPGSAKYISPLPAGYKTYGSGFGKRTHPVTGVKGKMHKGLDIGAPTGTPLVAMGDGTISLIRPNSETAGNYVKFVSKDGKFEFTYMHLSKFGKFKQNQKIKQGDVLGYVGNTGQSTGPHLHMEVTDLTGKYGKEGARLDPAEWAAKENGFVFEPRKKKGQA